MRALSTLSANFTIALPALFLISFAMASLPSSLKPLSVVSISSNTGLKLSIIELFNASSTASCIFSSIASSVSLISSCMPSFISRMFRVCLSLSASRLAISFSCVCSGNVSSSFTVKPLSVSANPFMVLLCFTLKISENTMPIIDVINAVFVPSSKLPMLDIVPSIVLISRSNIPTDSPTNVPSMPRPVKTLLRLLHHPTDKSVMRFSILKYSSASTVAYSLRRISMI